MQVTNHYPMHAVEFDLYTHAQVAAVVKRMQKIPVTLENIPLALSNLIKSLIIFVMFKV